MRIVIFILFLLIPLLGSAVERPGEELRGMLKNSLGNQVDLGMRFTDAKGESVEIGDLLEEKYPTLLVPAYYDCPRLCGLVMKGVSELVEEISLYPGRDFRVVTFSFDPDEGPELAAEQKEHYYSIGKARLDDPRAWSFLVGEQSSIDSLLRTVGFGTKKEGDDFAHSAAVFVLTPEGRVSQYFTGIQFHPRDLRLALVEASGGKIGSFIDQALLYCFRYDPIEGKYTWVAYGMLKLGGVLTLLFLGSLIGTLIWRQGKKSSE